MSSSANQKAIFSKILVAIDSSDTSMDYDVRSFMLFSMIDFASSDILYCAKTTSTLQFPT